jgi:hypothetical protein
LLCGRPDETSGALKEINCTSEITVGNFQGSFNHTIFVLDFLGCKDFLDSF